jgi:hypothetical protein
MLMLTVHDVHEDTRSLLAPLTPAHLNFTAVDMKRGEWLLLIASSIAAVGAIGLLFRKNWGRILSIPALVLFVIWSLAITVLSNVQAQIWFGFFQERWVAVMDVLIFSGSLIWLFSPLANREIQTNRKSA